MIAEIKGYDGKYSICSDGKVIRNPSKYRRRTIVLKPKPGKYLRVALYGKEGRKEFSIHRLVAEYFVDNPENKPWVNHKDGNKHNNSFENLEWCTPRENEMHSIHVLKRNRNTLKQRMSASKAGKSKRLLTMDEAEKIREQVATVSRKELSQKYNVSLSTIDKIVNKKSYVHE